MWRSVYDSVQGTSHVGSGVACQDACRVATVSTPDGEIFIGICADGAGSATHSDIGSALACDTLLTLASSYAHAHGLPLRVSPDQLITWYIEVQRRLTVEAASLGIAPRELACTLLLAIVGPTDAVFSQVGDGAVVAKANDAYSAVFWPQSGEYVNTTNFLTSDELAAVLEIRHIEDVFTDVAMFSDGLERLVLKFSDRTVHSPFLDPLFEKLRSTEDVEQLFAPLRDFLNSKGINERTDDDKTLILASRVN
ncbi:MAG: protein phosphatase 2C domain-containing protein [Verrucomicrobiales bacterium]|nr:protein phosphatase 2C domain-containing protein [Verrucomicrobiales bacterium]